MIRQRYSGVIIDLPTGVAHPDGRRDVWSVVQRVTASSQNPARV
jgi:hypothetical protein